MRVTLVISSLGAGGAERVMSIMANHWAACGWAVTLVTLGALSEDHYALHQGVDRVALCVSGDSATRWEALRNNLRRVARLRDAIRDARPDVVISFAPPTTILTLVAARPGRVPVVVSERIDPTRYPLPPFWAALRRVVYPQANAVVVQTPEVRRWAERFLRGGTVHVIPNPVMAPSVAPGHVREFERALAPRRARWRVVAVGRLHAQKGFDLLIRAFAACRPQQPDWDLVILGEGEERTSLEGLAAELGISSAVSLPGRVSCPATVMRESDLFVLSSRYEGFPNVLLEAMAAGLPVIATDCPTGPSHIVRDGVDGMLVPPEDVDVLARAMGALMGDRKRREALRARAGEVTERFAVDRVMADWGQLLRQIVPTPQRRGAA